MFLESLLGGKRHQEKVALDDVNFTVEKGDIMGVAGPNGAGKSTLLKIVAGVMPPSKGSVEVNGRVSAILELGTGFRDEYTGRENVLMGGLYLGYKRREILKRMGWIIEFSELEDSIDWPFGTYSTGMKARLMFSLAISANPEVLIVDEALAVGDTSFATKCFERINQICMYGATVFFVTHSMGYLTRSCNKAMFIDEGRLVKIGDPTTIAQMYDRIMLERNPEIAVDPYDFEEQLKLDKDVALLECSVAGLDSANTILVGQRIVFSFKVRSKVHIKNVFAFVQLVDTADGSTIASLHNRHALNEHYQETPIALDVEAGISTINVEVPYLNASRGKFALNFGMAAADSSYSYDNMLVFARNCIRFKVVRPDLFQNVSIELPTNWSIESKV
tara:strand:- start:2182 stop:3351 length:1170 start_codon:yes stop_codon:yes gene_type:complete